MSLPASSPSANVQFAREKPSGSIPNDFLIEWCSHFKANRDRGYDNSRGLIAEHRVSVVAKWGFIECSLRVVLSVPTVIITEDGD